ncbi:MAG: DUF3368 domain-containing protein [Verrucomicrobiae bacterium]|nr:DUF3368 domain-containing protein [Verrucomicrobiae bacterium]
MSNSSPLVYLTRLGRLELLPALYREVMIPTAVWTEVAIDGRGRPEADAVQKALAEGWLKVERVIEVCESEEEVFASLGAGEREAIILAQRRNAMLLIDEAEGRAVACRLALRHTGTLGVLLEARSRGLIPGVRPELERLREQTNFRFTEELFDSILRNAGEMQT